MATPMLIGTSSELIVLCAGLGSRFKGPGRKVLQTIGDVPLPVRLARQFAVFPTIFVIRDDWSTEEEDVLRPHGTTIRSAGRTIGESIADGLSARSADAALVVSGDTYMPDDMSIVIPRGRHWLLFDPWAWVSLLLLTTIPDMIASVRNDCTDKIAWAAARRLPCDLVRLPWRNINTEADLAAVRAAHSANGNAGKP